MTYIMKSQSKECFPCQFPCKLKANKNLLIRDRQVILGIAAYDSLLITMAVLTPPPPQIAATQYVLFNRFKA